jgi:HNH endonuclease
VEDAVGFLSGPLHPRWKGGKTTDRDGYVVITAGINRGKFEHRVIWEQKHGKIPRGFDVHHVNEIRNDNRDENFELRKSKPHRMEVLERINTQKRKGLTQTQ